MKYDAFDCQQSTQKISEYISSCVQTYRAIITEKEKAIKAAPLTRLRISKHNKTIQFYEIKNKGDTRGKYIPKSNISKIIRLAQRDYDTETVNILKKQLHAIETFKNTFIPQPFETISAKINPAKLKIVHTILQSNEAFAKHWQEKIVKGKNFNQDATVFVTSNGLSVRSKSELIIAETLLRQQIPFRYETPLHLKEWGKIHPDFTCLNTRTHKEYIWEHFGMMGDLDYANGAIKKLLQFAKNGFIQGKNLIISMETKDCPLSTDYIEYMIKNFLK